MSSDAEAVATVITAAEPTASSAATAILAILALNVPSLNVTFRTARIRGIRDGVFHATIPRHHATAMLASMGGDRSGPMMTNPADAPLTPR
ncbi:hypothetical protein [Streptomyces sp. NBC_00057]|uniref:hypothetical protein n=1 Tax=Streptomyces sp. NBC_00057 TaxID=2975634 RepID=UPI0032494216